MPVYVRAPNGPIAFRIIAAQIGRISGTPSTAGTVTVRINVTITLYGRTFVMPVDVALIVS